MNPIDKLRKMLDEANIPYENNIKAFPPEYKMIDIFGEPGKYLNNQVVFGRGLSVVDEWLFDAIWQAGSYGAENGLLETYGELGKQRNGEPDTMTPEEAFDVIKKKFDSYFIETTSCADGGRILYEKHPGFECPKQFKKYAYKMYI
jgi:hypothetical protein